MFGSKQTPGKHAVPCLILFSCLLLFAGCAIHLAPNYEPSILDGLNSFNVAILNHMASVADGTEKGLNAQQKAAYDQLKSQGKALKMLVKARPEPKPAFARWFGATRADDIPADGNADQIEVLKVPTGDQIDRILELLGRMEKKDREQGLQPGEYELYANAIESFMRNAITYEMALKR